MQLQEQVITKQQSEKLKALGFNSDSLYGYTKQREDLELKEWYLSGCRYFDSMSAYTASELMDILPDCIEDTLGGNHLNIWKSGDRYDVSYYEIDNREFALGGKVFQNKNLTHALGDMLIYLLENNLLPNQDK